MSTLPFVASKVEVSEFALDVQRGLGMKGQKWLPSQYLYDAIGSALFEVITLLPEYGVTRADERVLASCASEIASLLQDSLSVAELGSGSGRKTRLLLEALSGRCATYYPIDVSASALENCVKAVESIVPAKAIEATYFDGLSQVVLNSEEPILLLFLGSTIGNFGSAEATEFLREVRAWLKPGDHLLLGADLVKSVDRMLAAYDDSIGVTAAFNLNLLGRMNRELAADFEIRAFQHEARWNEKAKRIEMHLRSLEDQTVKIAGASVFFRTGETIWTESSHKFTLSGLDQLALESGWTRVRNWVDTEWPFANCLWRA